MAEESVSHEDWRAWVQSQIDAGELVNLAEWIRLRVAQPEVMAAIEALGVEEAAQVHEGIQWVLRDFANTGTVSEPAIRMFARTARRMIEFMPILFPSELKEAGEKFLQNPNRRLRK